MAGSVLSAAVSKRAQQLRRWVLQYYPYLTDEEVEEEAAAEPRDLGVCDGPSCVPRPPIGVLKS